MNNSEIADPLFREAVEAIDIGNASLLRQLLETNPQLVNQRLDFPKEGYFKYPYLLWFVAYNPIRHEKLPANIAEIAGLLIQFVRQYASDSFQEQMDYMLGLVATGRIPRECGVQLELIDLLIDEGAVPGDGHGALANGNMEAAQRLVAKSGRLTLTAAIGLNRMDDLPRLLKEATIGDRQTALIAAAFYGKPEIIRLLIASGVDVNAYIENGFHTHATALHQAVSSGSLECVKTLVEAGANLYAEDRVYKGTPLGWAMYMPSERDNEMEKKKYADIEAYLVSKQNE